MKKAYLPAIAVAAITLPVITVLYVKNQMLKREAATLRLEVEAPADGNSGPLRISGSPQGKKNNEGEVSREARFRAGGLQSILAERDPMKRIRMLVAFVENLDPDELPNILEDLREGSASWDQDTQMVAHMLLTRWAKADPDAAFASLNDLDFKNQRNESISIVTSLASQDPQRAAKWLEDPESGFKSFPWMGRMLATSIAKEWVRHDPDAALAWAASLPGDKQAGAYSGILVNLAASDPERAASLAEGLEPGKNRMSAVSEVARTWAKTDPVAVLEWSLTLDKASRESASRQAVMIWAQQNPKDAAAFVDTLSAEGSNVDSYMTSIAWSWSNSEPAEAAAWLGAQADGHGKQTAMSHVMWNWTKTSPEAAGEWLGTQPEGAARDSGIGGLVKAAFEFDPPGALAWAAQLSDEKRREQTVNRYAQMWVRRDSEAANQWAADNGVTIPDPPKAGAGASAGYHKLKVDALAR